MVDLAEQSIREITADAEADAALLREMREACGYLPEFGRVVDAGISDEEVAALEHEELIAEYIALRDSVNNLRRMLNLKEVTGG